MAHGYTLPENNLLDPKDRRWKIGWIKSSRRKINLYVRYEQLNRCTDKQLNDMIAIIVQGLIRESEIVANAYITGYR